MLLDRINSTVLRRGPRLDIGGRVLDPHLWEPGGRDVGAKRPEGWQPGQIFARGIRAGGRLRGAPEVALDLLRQIRVDTQ